MPGTGGSMRLSPLPPSPAGGRHAERQPRGGSANQAMAASSHHPRGADVMATERLVPIFALPPAVRVVVPKVGPVRTRGPRLGRHLVRYVTHAMFEGSRTLINVSISVSCNITLT